MRNFQACAVRFGVAYRPVASIDINSASNFTLMTIAAVILGGGTFSGGRALPVGATLGAVTLGLITVLLSLVNLSSSLQSAAQGLIVLAVLAGRVITERFTR